MQSARFVRAATIVCSVVPALAIAATSQRLTGTRHMGALVRGALAGVERSKILVPIWAQGGTPCLYFPTFDWRGPIVRAIPPPRGVARVELTLVDAYALVARAPGGFMMALDTPEPLGSRTSGAYGPGAPRVARQPVGLARTGAATIPGARIELIERDARFATALRIRFEQPVERHVFVQLEGCAAAHRVAVGSGPAPGRE
jgi:hypothetical protein